VGASLSAAMKISEFNFGEYDARREFLRAEQYFMQTFISPVSFALNTLSNRNNYIIVGQKGSGKTACQLYLENQKAKKEGYLSGLISFYDDLTPEDYINFASTQRINLISTDQIERIETLYDFKEIWKRILFIRIAKLLEDNGFSNTYTKYCLSTTKGTNSIIDGIKKSLKVEVSIPIALLQAKIKFDPSVFGSNQEVSLLEFNQIAEQLFSSECKQHRMYFFVDELVISNLNTKSDEYKARLALVRDIVRTCCYLNDLCVREALDFHFICNLRPEIRTRLNDVDPEISKIMDGNDVFLSWDEESLLEIMTQKIVNGSPRLVVIDADKFLPKTITFGGRPVDFLSFFLNNSWYKPRDVIRFLKAYAKINPSDEVITESGVKRALNEYARISAVELFEQISVRYSPDVIEVLKTNINQRNYKNAGEIADSMKTKLNNIDTFKLVQELYDAGVIGNVDYVNGKRRYFWSHRQEEMLDWEMGVTIHPGLLNYFNIRHR
jgi:hypothetical protein